MGPLIITPASQFAEGTNAMRTMLLALAGAATLAGCSTYGTGYYDDYGRYDYNRPDPRYGGYYADRYYRDDPRYRERRLSRNDRVYRGRDGRYYCRRSDGTTGLIVGGLAGGVLRSEEHTSELLSLMRNSYAVF